MSNKIPNCPGCKNHARFSREVGRNRYKCSIHGFYDNNPNEGGATHNDPERCLEKNEEFRAREQRKARELERRKKLYQPPKIF